MTAEPAGSSTVAFNSPVPWRYAAAGAGWLSGAAGAGWLSGAAGAGWLSGAAGAGWLSGAAGAGWLSGAAGAGWLSGAAGPLAGLASPKSFPVGRAGGGVAGSGTAVSLGCSGRFDGCRASGTRRDTGVVVVVNETLTPELSDCVLNGTSSSTSITTRDWLGLDCPKRTPITGAYSLGTLYLPPTLKRVSEKSSTMRAGESSCDVRK